MFVGVGVAQFGDLFRKGVRKCRGGKKHCVMNGGEVQALLRE